MRISAPTIDEMDKRGIPLSVRFLGTFSSPIVVTLIAAVILGGGYILGEFATGRLHRVVSGTEGSLALRATAMLFVLVAYIPLAHLQLRRWTNKHLLTLRASIGAGVTYEQSAPANIAAGVVGAATFLFLFMIIPIYVAGAPDMTFQIIATTVSGTAYGWLAGRFLVCMVTDSLQMSKLARALPDLDLLDLGSLSPFVQQGLKSVLPLVIVLTITSHLYIAPGSAVIGSSAFLLIWCALTVVVFTLPVRGIHDRICVEKQAQLEKVRTEIRNAWERVVDRRDASAGDWLSALLDLEMRLERVRAWPYDTSIWLKFGLYMLLGVGSWFGAAAVDRLLNSLL